MTHTIEQRPPCQPLVGFGQIDHHVRDMTATFDAAVTLSQAQARLAEHGQWLAVDGDPHTPLGTLALRNSTGPLRQGFGAWRDLLLGVQFRDRSDQLVTAGGRVVKNVAGYDFTKLVVGSHGLLGPIVTLTTRCYRRPAGAVRATFLPDPSRLSSILVSDLAPQYALLDTQSLTLGYLGDERALNFYAEKLKAAEPTAIVRSSLEDDIAFRGQNFSARTSLRASVPPTKVAALVKQLGLVDYAADPVFGIVVARDAVDESRLHQTAQSLGGFALKFDAAGHPTRRPVSVELESVMQKLEAAFGASGGSSR